MAIEDDLALIREQERVLQFDRFNLDSAWELGRLLRQMAVAAGHPIAIDIHINGMPAFYAALPGSVPDNAQWVRRKRNVATRFGHASYAVGLGLARDNRSVSEKYGVDETDYAAHGGSFPIVVRGVGAIGAVTVSGLPQREDHKMVVLALAEMLGVDAAPLDLDAGPVIV
ncbi:heme-degrading domain-containing protein [Neorhizobium sp. NPDC001467]|uniref:heme-degrading domain-containing protein n=1 Tax=Neorhizobium sp. NPDC001467 TaxID=3390595 RepID=UPI003D010D40